MATAWGARALAELHRWDDANARMEAIDELASPLGLLPEQVDPTSRAFLGNLGSSPAHLAVLDAALALAAGPR